MFLYFFIIESWLLYGSDSCRLNYKSSSTCCGNYHKVNGTCEVCPSGYIGRGEKCDIPCPTGYHGVECAEKCQCESTERCDNELGCICDPMMHHCHETDAKMNTYLNSMDNFSDTDIAWKEILIITFTAVFCVSSLTLTSSYMFWHWYLG